MGKKKTDPERIPNKNVDAMANREMCSLLILFLPSVKLILQKGGRLEEIRKQYCIEGSS